MARVFAYLTHPKTREHLNLRDRLRNRFGLKIKGIKMGENLVGLLKNRACPGRIEIVSLTYDFHSTVNLPHIALALIPELEHTRGRKASWNTHVGKGNIGYAALAINKETKKAVIVELQSDMYLPKERKEEIDAGMPMAPLEKVKKRFMKEHSEKYKKWDEALIAASAEYCREHGLDLYLISEESQMIKWGKKGLARDTARRHYTIALKNACRKLGVKPEKVNKEKVFDPMTERTTLSAIRGTDIWHIPIRDKR